MPAAHSVILDNWAGPPDAFFRTSGTTDAAIATSGLGAPGFHGAGATETAPPEIRTLAPADLSRLQAEIVALTDHDHPIRLQLSGPIHWNGTLDLEGAHDLALDFTAARVEVATTADPLIRIARSGRIAVHGLAIGQRNACVLDIASSYDIAITACALSGASDGALRITGRCERVLVDRSAFLRNDGPAIRGSGEVVRLIVARSGFEGPAPQGHVRLSPIRTARGLPHPEAHEPARDALSTGYPTEVRLLENRFAPCPVPAIAAEGTLGLWIERNDFTGATHSAVALTGPAAGLMVADNRLAADPASPAPLVTLVDAALACVFRNNFEPARQPALQVSGSFGGLLVAANTVLPLSADIAPGAAIELAPAGAFLATTLMLNTIRGPFSSGIVLQGELPRLFLFDNHLVGMTGYSVESQVAQPSVTALNNWSPQRSLNLSLAGGKLSPARLFHAATRRLRATAAGRSTPRQSH